MPIKLSVIIPVYKVEDYLERCVDSVLSQNFCDFEVILVDDGSPDNCPQICDDLAKKDGRISVIHKQNGGLSTARNEGIYAAKGKYIAFLDSDDQWQSQKLSQLMFDVEREPIDMLLFDSVNIYPDGSIRKRAGGKLFEKAYQILNIEDYYKLIISEGGLCESACTKIISREFLIDNKLFFYQGITGEDSEWMLRVLRCANNIAISNVELFLCTCFRSGSIQNSVKPKNINDLINTIDKSVEFYKSNGDTALMKYELEHCAYLVANAIGLLIHIESTNDKNKLKLKLHQKMYLFKYATNRKTRMVKIVYKILGFDFMMWLLETYMILMKKNILNRKVKI